MMVKREKNPSLSMNTLVVHASDYNSNDDDEDDIL